MKDFTPIAGIGENMLVLMVKSSFPAKNLAEFVAHAKARPGKLSAGYGSSTSQVSISLLNKLAGLALAKEVGREGIRVNALRPGLISTEIHNLHGGIEQMQKMAAGVAPMGRAGSADEVAQAALWLASDAASYVHGSEIDVAGGR